MASWTGNTPYPPNPRPRSRSRSPYRGVPASYPPPGAPAGGRPGSWAEYAPGPDAYRAEWDVYDRDRGYYDRPAYDYNRRGRSRSPGLDDGSRKRRRSPSPYGADRYEPRPRYADDYDAHSRGGYGYNRPRHGSGRAPQDPHTLDYPASLRQYAEWFRYYHPQQAAEEDQADRQAEAEAGDGTRPRNGIRSLWEKYKKEFAAGQLQTMFDHHRKSPWFAEKYDPAPEFAYLRARTRKEGWRGRLAAFVQDIASGSFDPALDAYDDEPEPTLIPNDASRAEVDGPEDKPKTEPAQDEEMKDVKKEPESAPVPVKEEKKEIKEDDDGGIAPNDESMKMEEDDHEQDEGDKQDGASVNGKGTGARVARSDEISVDAEGNQVMIRTIPPDIGRAKLEKHGNFNAMSGYVYLALGDPLQKRNFYRAGWLKFREDADMAAVMRELNEKKIDGFKLHVIHNTQPFRNKVRYTPEAASRPERIVTDLANVRALAAKLDAEYRHVRHLPVRPEDAGEDWEKTAMEEWAAKSEGQGQGEDAKMEGADEEEEDSLPAESGAEAVEKRVEVVMADLKEAGKVDEADTKAYELKKNTVTLDLYLAYLRNAYHTCYYCAIVTDHLEEFQRKCISHVRRPLTYAMRMDLEREEQKKREKEEKEREEKELAEKVKEEQGMETDAKEKDVAAEGEEKKGDKNEATKQDKLAEAKDWKRNDERWIEWLDSKVALLIKRDEVDPREYGGKAYEDELSKVAEPHIKQEDEGKFRCKTCTKLFKAVAFVEKHIANKHSELLRALDELPYFNNFALDPHHVQPLAHPPSQGAQPVQQQQPYGAPYPPPGDYPRGAPGGYYPPLYGGYGGPPPPAYGGHWGGGGGGEPYGYPPYGGPPFNAPPSGKRLGDRIGGYAPGYGEDLPPAPPAAGLPPKPDHGGPGDDRRRGSQRRRTGDLPPPPPPPDAKEDPRAAAGRKLSYHDMDSVAEGDIELQY